MKRMAKAGCSRSQGASNRKRNAAVTSPDPHREGHSTLAWMGRIACLLIAFAVATPSVCMQQKDTSSQDDDTASFTPRSRGSLAQAGSEDDLQRLKPLEDNIETGQYQETVAGL